MGIGLGIGLGLVHTVEQRGTARAIVGLHGRCRQAWNLGAGHSVRHRAWVRVRVRGRVRFGVGVGSHRCCTRGIYRQA